MIAAEFEVSSNDNGLIRRPPDRERDADSTPELLIASFAIGAINKKDGNRSYARNHDASNKISAHS